MVFYRKYRPQIINDLDSAQVRETLLSVLALPEPPHAFLFTGPKGLGKTSTARIIAKAVNCLNHTTDKQTKKRSIEPCNTCDHCTSIMNGSNMDIMEIDAASNRGIDEIRDLREKIKLSPVSAKKKIYIIDEVHMLTTEAFNALLKTLEEPPAHAMFILCTTERHKVPDTIRSRCFTLSFQNATKEELTRAFMRIATGENFQIADDALDALVQLSDGGFRDGTKILEELVTLFSSETDSNKRIITKALIDGKYQLSNISQFTETLLTAFAKKDVKAGLSVTSALVEQGIDLQQFVQVFMRELHTQLLQKVGPQKKEKIVKKKETTLSIAELSFLLQLMSKVSNDTKHAILPQLPLELTLIEWSSAQEIENDPNPVVAVTQQKVTAKPNGNVSETVTTVTMRKQLGDLARVKALYGEPKQPVKADAVVTEQKPRINLLNVSNSEITPEWLDAFWQTFILEMKQYNHTVAGVLRSCSVKSFDTKTLTIEAAFPFHKERLDDGKVRDTLASVCKVLTGNPVVVEVLLKSK